MKPEKKKITCCKGMYHILIDGKYYCMAPPNIECPNQNLAAGRFTRGEKKICYCRHENRPCSECTQLSAIDLPAEQHED